MLGLVRELARDPILAARLYGKAAIPVAGRILSGSVEHARGSRTRQRRAFQPFLIEAKRA